MIEAWNCTLYMPKNVEIRKVGNCPNVGKLLKKLRKINQKKYSWSTINTAVFVGDKQ